MKWLPVNLKAVNARISKNEKQLPVKAKNSLGWNSGDGIVIHVIAALLNDQTRFI